MPVYDVPRIVGVAHGRLTSWGPIHCAAQEYSNKLHGLQISRLRTLRTCKTFEYPRELLLERSRACRACLGYREGMSVQIGVGPEFAPTQAEKQALDGRKYLLLQRQEANFTCLIKSGLSRVFESWTPVNQLSPRGYLLRNVCLRACAPK